MRAFRFLCAAAVAPGVAGLNPVIRAILMNPAGIGYKRTENWLMWLVDLLLIRVSVVTPPLVLPPGVIDDQV